MGTYNNSSVIWECYIIYLRKSRQDDPNETIEEVLSKHETMLQEFAQNELGGRIPEGNIYREVVSGESIDEREEIKKVLARVEDPNILGVLVIEPQRLSRGDLEDCGRLINDLRYTHTKVVTPMMTYNLENKMERKFFQDELLRGRDYLEYTKEILNRGRIAAVKRGCFIGSTAPLGYDRIKKGKDWTLEANDDADTIRMIFDLYVKEGLIPTEIANRLNGLGIKSKKGVGWRRDTVREVLKNQHYIGKVVYNRVKETWVVENGERVKRYLKQPEEEIIVAEGKHDGIISPALFEAARNRLRSNPRLKREHVLINVLAGVLKCSKCGRTMHRKQKNKKITPRFECPQGCMKSAKYDEVVEAVIVALKEAELPKLQAKLESGEGDAANIQKRRIEKLNKQMEEYRDQEDEQYELLERKKYTQEVFDRRNASLRKKMDECEKQIHLARAALPKNIDYTEKVVKLERAIEALDDKTMPVLDQNRLVRAIIERIEFTSKCQGYGQTDVFLDVFLRL